MIFMGLSEKYRIPTGSNFERKHNDKSLGFEILSFLTNSFQWGFHSPESCPSNREHGDRLLQVGGIL